MSQPLARASTWVRWPMLFSLRACDATFWEDCPERFEFVHDYDAPPDVVHRTFLALAGDPPWAPGFLGLDWHSPPGEHGGACMDELYSFMTMRVRVIEHEPGSRSVMCVERWSLPLATRMVQIIEPTPHAGGTRLRYRIGYEVPWFGRPFHPVVAAWFRWWFRVSLDGLARVCAQQVATAP